MATVTIYLLNTTASSPNWFGRVQDGGSAPAGALSAFGWTVAKVATTTEFWRGFIGATARSAAAVTNSYIDSTSGPAQGTGSGATTAGDSFRSDAPLNGTFAAGNWVFTFGMRTGAATNAGRIRFHMWASVNASGASARKLNSTTLVGTTVTMNSATTTFNSTVTWNAPSVVLANEYLFLQLEWEVTTAGTSNSCTAQFYAASFVTTDYVYAPATGTLAVTEAAADTALNGFTGTVATAPATGTATADENSGVELILHCDGPDGSTAFLDSASFSTVTAHGAAQIDTQSVFDGQSLMLAAGTDYLSLDTGDYAFGTGDFCVDMRVRLLSVSAPQMFYDGGEGGFTINYDGALLFESVAGTITGSVLVADTNYHIAATRGAGSTRLWLNGTQQGSTLADTTNYTVAATYPRIGGGVTDWWITGSTVDLDFQGSRYRYTDPTEFLSCTRASIGYAQTSDGTLVSFATNALRITDLGLLVEDARTNYAPYSETFNLAGGAWSAQQATITINAATAPNGTSTATQLIEDTNNGPHNVYWFNSVAFNGVTVFSVYAKAASRTNIILNWYDINNNAGYGVNFDLTNGVVSSTQSTTSPAPTNTSNKIEAMGGGWYRCTITATTTNQQSYYITMSSSSTPTWSGGPIFRDTYTGNGTSHLFVWGAQVELATFASSYIPTTTASATRAADDIALAGAAALTTIGSAVLDFQTPLVSTDYNRFLQSRGGANIIIGQSPGVGGTVLLTWDAGIGSVLSCTIGSSQTILTGTKAGTAWDATGRSIVAGAGTVATDTALMGISGTAKLSYPGYTWQTVRRLTLWPTRLSGTTLQDLTSPTGADPTGYAVDLNFATGGYFVAAPTGVLTCTRASTGYAQTAAGTLTSFATNTLRITDLGLLVEDARTNYMAPSEDFSFFSGSGLTVTANTTVAPNGLTTASTIALTSTGYAYASISTAPHATQDCTFSIWLKGTAGDKIAIRMHNNAATTIFYQLVTLTSSWQRYSVSGNMVMPDGVASFGLDNRTIIDAQLGNTITLQAWGAQFEVGAFVSSYIPTTTAAATRAADEINPIGGLLTIVRSSTVSAVASLDVAPALGTLSELHIISSYGHTGDRDFYLASATSIGMKNYTGDSGLIKSGLPSCLTTASKYGFARNSSGRSTTGAGLSVATDSYGVAPGGNVYLGQAGAGYGQFINTYIRRLTVWSTRLTDATLQGLTAP